MRMLRSTFAGMVTTLLAHSAMAACPLTLTETWQTAEEPKDVVVVERPDATFVYTANETGDSISAFERTVGGLVGLETENDGTNRDGMTALAASPNHAHLYALAGGSFGHALITYSIGADGRLARQQTVNSGAAGVPSQIFSGAGDVVVTPDGEHVYTVSATSETLVWLDRDTSTGLLTYRDHIQDQGLDGPVHLTIADDGTRLYVANMAGVSGGTGRVLVFTIGNDGTPSAGPALTLPSPHTRAFATLVDGERVYVIAGAGNPSADGRVVLTYVRNLVTGGFGALLDTETFTNADIRHMAFSADRSRIFVTALDGNSVTTFNRDAVTGTLTRFCQPRTWPQAAGPFAIAVTSDDGALYVTNAAEANATGLTELAHDSCGDGNLDATEACDAGVEAGTTCCTNVCQIAAPAGTTCDEDGKVCTADVCDDAGVCTHPTAPRAGAVCRAAIAGGCDVAETCDGASEACPSNGFAPASTVCRPAAGDCDVTETCSGTSATCPLDQKRPAGTVCRAVDGVCDVAESCNGTSSLCPTNQFQAATVPCRTAVGPCDAVETCTGTGPLCPADAVRPPNTICRAATGACDVAETCDGATISCPADALQPASHVCRPAVGSCDVAEQCSGGSAQCPADQLAPSGTVCRTEAGACDIAEVCTGAAGECPADSFASAGTVCRTANGQCDLAEQCTGQGASCPADAAQPDGTVCDDQAGCPIDTCSAGACAGRTTCRDIPTRVVASSISGAGRVRLPLRDAPTTVSAVDATPPDVGVPPTPIFDSITVKTSGKKKKVKISFVLSRKAREALDATGSIRVAFHVRYADGSDEVVQVTVHKKGKKGKNRAKD